MNNGFPIWDQKTQRRIHNETLKAIDAAYKKAIEITETHKPKALPDGAKEAISDVVRYYEAE